MFPLRNYAPPGADHLTRQKPHPGQRALHCLREVMLVFLAAFEPVLAPVYWRCLRARSAREDRQANEAAAAGMLEIP